MFPQFNQSYSDKKLKAGNPHSHIALWRECGMAIMGYPKRNGSVSVAHGLDSFACFIFKQGKEVLVRSLCQQEGMDLLYHPNFFDLTCHTRNVFSGESR